MQIYFVSLSVYSEFYVIFAAVNKIISWIMMKRSNLWMLATILACGLLMASCIDEQIDNPSTTEPEKPSAKDPGKWWIDENNMDKSVNPGDNFFMYCNGSWWKNTTIPQGKIYVDQFTNVKPTFQDRIGSLPRLLSPGRDSTTTCWPRVGSTRPRPRKTCCAPSAGWQRWASAQAPGSNLCSSMARYVSTPSIT